MSERWRKPAGIVAIESHTDTVRFGQDTRLMRDYDVTVTPETYERMRQGRMCGQCYEPFEEAWPVTCGVCGFKVRASQGDWLEAQFLGEQWIGPRETISDELERLAEDNERAMHKAGSSIVVPSWAKPN